MRFSIIVPAYNSEHYIAECLASIDRQTYNDFELIVVDDGSADETAQVVSCFCEDRCWAHLIRQKNRGTFLARRAGLSVAVGEYVVFVDADDGLASNALDTVAAAIDRTGADIVSFGFSRMPDFSTSDDVTRLAPGMYEGDSYTFDVKRLVARACFNSLWGKAIRRCRVDHDAVYGAKYEHFLMAEDLYQLVPIVDSATSLYRIDVPLYYYRSNSGSNMGSWHRSYIRDVRLVDERLLEYGSKWGMPGDAAIGAVGLFSNITAILNRSSDSREVREASEEIREALLKLPMDAAAAAKLLSPGGRIRISFVLRRKPWVGMVLDHIYDVMCSGR
jgi:glycosyltransferase involved in cell wall biosynthesis